MRLSACHEHGTKKTLPNGIQTYDIPKQWAGTLSIGKKRKIVGQKTAMLAMCQLGVLGKMVENYQSKLQRGLWKARLYTKFLVKTVKRSNS